MALLDALRVPRDGLLARFSFQLAQYLLSGRGNRGQICMQGTLRNSVVVLPVYSTHRPWRWSPDDMPQGAEFPAARLSLLALLATWRAGGTVAPVTPELLEPPKDRGGRLLISEARWERREVPSVLQQWQPKFVLSFGALDDLLFRAADLQKRGGVWSEAKYLQLKLGYGSQSEPSSMATTAIPMKNDEEEALDWSDVALSMVGGEHVTYADLLAAVDDPSGDLPINDEATSIVRLLRLARFNRNRNGEFQRQQRVQRPWWVHEEQLSTFWPPKKLPPLPSVWTAVDAFDPARQGRTLDGEVYYWNRETNETTWSRPFGGRRSSLVSIQRSRAKLSGARLSAKSGPNGRVWPKRHRATLKLKLSLAFNRSHIHNKVLKEYAPEN